MEHCLNQPEEWEQKYKKRNKEKKMTRLAKIDWHVIDKRSTPMHCYDERLNKVDKMKGDYYFG